jgi:hypothetical protein
MHSPNPTRSENYQESMDVMASLKALGVLVAAWLLAAFIGVLPTAAIANISETLPMLPHSLLGISLVGLIGLAYILTTKLKHKIRWEILLWIIPLWVCLYAGAVYVNEMVEPAMACKKAESFKVSDSAIYETYASSPLKAECDTTGRMGQLDGFVPNIIGSKTLLAFLAASLLGLGLMVNLRYLANLYKFGVKDVIVGLLIIQVVYGALVSLLMTMAVIETLVVVTIRTFEFPVSASRFALGYYVPLGLCVVIALVMLVNYICVFKKLKKTFR